MSACQPGTVTFSTGTYRCTYTRDTSCCASMSPSTVDVPLPGMKRTLDVQVAPLTASQPSKTAGLSVVSVVSETTQSREGSNDVASLQQLCMDTARQRLQPTVVCSTLQVCNLLMPDHCVSTVIVHRDLSQKGAGMARCVEVACTALVVHAGGRGAETGSRQAPPCRPRLSGEQPGGGCHGGHGRPHLAAFAVSAQPPGACGAGAVLLTDDRYPKTVCEVQVLLLSCTVEISNLLPAGLQRVPALGAGCPLGTCRQQ